MQLSHLDPVTGTSTPQNYAYGIPSDSPSLLVWADWGTHTPVQLNLGDYYV